MRIHQPLLLLLLASSACSEDTERLLEKTESLIDSAGGVARSADGLVAIQIPAGALSEPTRITVETLRDEHPARLVSLLYDLGPAGQTFAVPVRFELQLESSQPLVLAHFDPQAAIVAGSTYHGGVLSAPLMHFSKYGAIAQSVYEPCAGLSCGDECSPCDPTDPVCSPLSDSSCDSGGACVATSSVSCNSPDAGTQTGGQFVVSPATVDFGVVQVGSIDMLVVNLSNVGTDAGLLFTALTSAPFSARARVPATVPAGGSFSMPVMFTPTSAGTFTATLTIAASDGDHVVSMIGQGQGTTTGTCTETFQQPANGKLDVLLIVDNSCSMAEEQLALGNSATVLISALQSQNLDYHVGVTTTDVDTGGAEGRLLATFGNGTRIIDQSTVDPIGDLQELVDAGTAGSALEQGLEAIELALSPPASTGVNSGFLRDDAWLAVIVLSDEEDQSPQAVTDYVNFLNGLKAPHGERAVQINAITGGPSGCNGPGGNAQNELRYGDAVDATGGVAESICLAGTASTAWGSALGYLGGDGLGLPFQLALEGTPSGNINVQSSVGPLASMFDGATNILVLTGTIPPALSDITVTYDGACP